MKMGKLRYVFIRARPTNGSVLEVPFERKYLVNMQNKPFGKVEGGVGERAVYEPAESVELWIRIRILTHRKLDGKLVGWLVCLAIPPPQFN